jgi:hypothetical protein
VTPISDEGLREAEVSALALIKHRNKARELVLAGHRKQKRIESFIHGTFSVPLERRKDDVDDENLGADLLDYSDALYDALRCELARGASHIGEELDADTIAFSLLGSGDDSLACNLVDAPTHELTFRRIWAHVYCLESGMSYRMMESVARRTWLVIMNFRSHTTPTRRERKPGGKS